MRGVSIQTIFTLKIMLTEPFIKQTDGTFKVTLKDLENKPSTLLLINLMFDSKENRELINRITVGSKNYLRSDFSNDPNAASSVIVYKPVNRNDRSVMEITLTGNFNNHVTCKLGYLFTEDELEIDAGFKKEDSFTLND